VDAKFSIFLAIFGKCLSRSLVASTNFRSFWKTLLALTLVQNSLTHLAIPTYDDRPPGRVPKYSPDFPAEE
jgi:hypothetical protein